MIILLQKPKNTTRNTKIKNFCTRNFLQKKHRKKIYLKKLSLFITYPCVCVCRL